MENLSMLIALIAIVFLLAFLIVAFVMLFRMRKRLVVEKHHDDIVEENIALQYSKFLRSKDAKDADFRSYSKKRLKAKRRWGILWDVLCALVAIAAVAVLGLSVAYRYTEGTTYVGGKAFLVVTTDSMSEKHDKNEDLVGHDDQIPQGAFVTFDRVKDGEALVPFEVYAYLNEDGEVIVHRLIEQNEDGTYLFRGDKNQYPTADDSKVRRDQIIGKYNGDANVPLGYTILFLKSPIGLLVIAALFCIIVIQTTYSDKLKKLYRERSLTLMDDAEEIYRKYVRIDEDRRIKRTLLSGIELYPEGCRCYVLYGDENFSTGEQIVVEGEEKGEVEGRIVSSVNPYPSAKVRIRKEILTANLSEDR